jgi:hypothetical protein
VGFKVRMSCADERMATLRSQRGSPDVTYADRRTEWMELEQGLAAGERVRATGGGDALRVG